MNLSKNELLKMAINSKPKKEVLEKKSKNELIEYLFGVKVDDCSKKKINESEKRLEKCLSPIPLYRPGYLREASFSTQPSFNPQPDLQRLLPDINSALETIKKWNEEEKPNAFELLENARKSVSEWINIQRPYFEDKLQKVENILLTWERIDKPNIDEILAEVRDTRAVVQNLDMTLIANVQNEVTNYLKIQKPNIETQYNQILNKFQQIGQSVEQIRNENIKLLQLIGPIEQLQLTFKNASALQDFKSAIEQQVLNLQLGYEQQLALTTGNDISQIGELSLQVSQNEQTISSMEGDIAFIKSIFEQLKQQWIEEFRKFLDEHSVKEIAFEQKQSLDFGKRTKQLQIEYEQVIDQKIRTLTQTQVSGFRELQRSIFALQQELSEAAVPLALGASPPLQAITQAPNNLELVVRDLSQNTNNQLTTLSNNLSSLNDFFYALQTDQRKINGNMAQISQEMDTIQRTNNDVIAATVNRAVNESVDANLRLAAQEMVSQKINEEIRNRGEQIKFLIQEELNVAVPRAIQQVLDNRVQAAAQKAVVAALADQTTQSIAAGVVRNTIQDIVRQEIMKQKEFIRATVIQVVNSEKKSVLTQLAKSPMASRIQQRVDKLREENNRLQNALILVNSRLAKLEFSQEPQIKKRKSATRANITTIASRPPIIPALPIQF
jgi:hypothetical protein